MAMGKARNGGTGRGLTGKIVYIATIAALLGVSAGSVMGTLLTTTTISQTANFYEGGNNGVANWPAPTLTLANTPTIVACSAGTQTVTASASGTPTVDVVLSASGSSGTCASGDFAELFAFDFVVSATSVNQQDTVSITTQIGSGAVTTNSISVTLITGGSGGPFDAILDLYVDYGSLSPPSAGITVLDLVVQ